MAVSDKGTTNKLKYSVNNGESFKEYTFSDDLVRVTRLTIEPSSTRMKFLIYGKTVDSKSVSTSSISIDFSVMASSYTEMVYHVDFSRVFDKECTFKEDGSGDYEKWYPTANDCVMGEKVFYWRRKQSSNCAIPKTMSIEAKIEKTCECSDTDFECDVGFWRNAERKCVPSDGLSDEPIGCASGTEYQSKSGYRKASKTKCAGGQNLEATVTRKCTGNAAPPISDPTLAKNVHIFDSTLENIHYFMNSTTVVARDSSNAVWQSLHSGRDWKKLDIQEPVLQLVENPYFPDRLYFFSSGKVHIVSQDKGLSMEVFNTPLPPNTMNAPILEFHSEERGKNLSITFTDYVGFYVTSYR